MGIRAVNAMSTPDQQRVGKAQQAQRDKEHGSQDHCFHTLPGQETGKGPLGQGSDLHYPFCHSLRQERVQQFFHLTSQGFLL